MKNLNRWEIANHLHTSIKETYPCETDTPANGLPGVESTSGGEFYSRQHSSPEGHSRDDRSFTQSLWGRR